ncbi:MAG: OB-fold domain-containing protein, partial [Candidatus Cybelea sp.]
MFARISGSLLERTGDTAIVEAAGLGYEIVLPPCIADKLPVRAGDRVALEIYAVLNMDGNSGRFTYYGFTNAIEREFFEALLTVSSIGPRSAARAFSLPMSTIAAAIDRGDYALLKT